MTTSSGPGVGVGRDVTSRGLPASTSMAARCSVDDMAVMLRFERYVDSCNAGRRRVGEGRMHDELGASRAQLGRASGAMRLVIMLEVVAQRGEGVFIAHRRYPSGLTNPRPGFETSPASPRDRFRTAHVGSDDRHHELPVCISERLC